MLPRPCKERAPLNCFVHLLHALGNVLVATRTQSRAASPHFDGSLTLLTVASQGRATCMFLHDGCTLLFHGSPIVNSMVEHTVSMTGVDSLPRSRG